VATLPRNERQKVLADVDSMVANNTLAAKIDNLPDQLTAGSKRPTRGNAEDEF